MKTNRNGFMRILIMVDVPTQTNKEKKEYRLFRKYLIKNGFDMIQYSIYSKLVSDNNAAKREVALINSNLPSKGLIRALIITEKQYNSMYVLLGDATVSECILTTDDIIEL